MGTASGEPGGERLEGSGDLAVPRCLERRTGRRVSRGLSLHGPGFRRLPLWSPELPGLLGSLLHLPNACWVPGLGLGTGETILRRVATVPAFMDGAHDQDHVHMLVNV